MVYGLELRGVMMEGWEAVQMIVSGQQMGGNAREGVFMCEIECGDGFKAVDEECDDGNLINLDGCTSNCKKEIEICGDGIIVGNEGCNDNNTKSGGCNPTCTAQTNLLGTAAEVPTKQHLYAEPSVVTDT